MIVEIDNMITNIDTSYRQAIACGQIDSNKVDIEQFADVIAEDIEFYDAAIPDCRSEVMESKRAVALLFKSKETRQQIINKWFGGE